MTPRKSLSFAVALWTAVAVAVVMAAYAVLEYFVLQQGMTVKELVLRHLWHVLALGAVIHVTCWFVLRHLLVEPLNGIYLHLYAVGQGKLEPLKFDSRLHTIQSIVEGINLMIWRLGQASDTQTVLKTKQQIAHLSELAGFLSANEPEAARQLQAQLRELEASLLTLAQRPSNPTPGRDGATTFTSTNEGETFRQEHRHE